MSLADAASRYGGFPVITPFEGNGTQREQSDRYLQIAFASAIAILILVIALYYRSMAVSRDSEAWVQHSHLVSGNLENMLYAMTNIDASGARLSDDRRGTLFGILARRHGQPQAAHGDDPQLDPATIPHSRHGCRHSMH